MEIGINKEELRVPMTCMKIVNIQRPNPRTTTWNEIGNNFETSVDIPPTSRGNFLITFACPHCGSLLVFQVFTQMKGADRKNASRYISELILYKLPSGRNAHRLNMHDKGKTARTHVTFDECYNIPTGDHSYSAPTKPMKPFERLHPDLFSEDGRVNGTDFSENLLLNMSADELSILFVERPEESVDLLTQMPNAGELMLKVSLKGRGTKELDPRPTGAEVQEAIWPLLKKRGRIDLAWNLAERRFSESASIFMVTSFIMAFCSVWWTARKVGLPFGGKGTMALALLLFISAVFPFVINVFEVIHYLINGDLRSCPAKIMLRLKCGIFALGLAIIGIVFIITMRVSGR